MAPLSTVCLALGVATAMASHAQPAIHHFQGGGSGIVTEKDYIENKIARGVYGVFGTAAEEAKEAGKHIKSAAKSSAESSRKAAEEAANKGTSFWHAAEAEADEVSGPKVSWVNRKEQQGNRSAAMKFFGNPNNAFVAQGITALIVGGLHIFSYDSYIRQWATPLYKLFRGEVGSVAVVRSHAVVMGSFLLGVFISDVLAYKSNSAGFKRGKVFHELSTNAVILLLGGIHLATTEDPTDILPHVVGALVFSAWYGLLSKEY